MLPTAKLRISTWALNPPRVSHFVVLIDDKPVAVIENKELELAAAQLAILETSPGNQSR